MSHQDVTFGESAETGDKEVAFSHFLTGLLIVTTHIAQAVALLTVAFAVRAGWWPGWISFVAIGAAIGIAFHQRSYCWSIQIIEWIALGIGGAIVGLLMR